MLICKKKLKRNVCLVIMFFVLISAGCVIKEPQGFQADAPLYIRPPARTLAGTSAGDLFVPTENTVADIPLTSQYVRQV